MSGLGRERLLPSNNVGHSLLANFVPVVHFRAFMTTENPRQSITVN